jgi:hypothetical protein
MNRTMRNIAHQEPLKRRGSSRLHFNQLRINGMASLSRLVTTANRAKGR